MIVFILRSSSQRVISCISQATLGDASTTPLHRSRDVLYAGAPFFGFHQDAISNESSPRSLVMCSCIDQSIILLGTDQAPRSGTIIPIRFYGGVIG